MKLKATIGLGLIILGAIVTFGFKPKSTTIIHGDEKGIHFFHGTFEEAKTLAAKENKLIFLDAYASWCGPCKIMAKNTFTDNKVGEFYNENFINLKIDMEKGEGPELAKKYGVTAYPTLIYLDKDGNVVNRSKGLHKPAQFITLGERTMSVKK